MVLAHNRSLVAPVACTKHVGTEKSIAHSAYTY